jgi:hypothetical protein
MSEIHQSVYNPDELSWEVISEIHDQLVAIDPLIPDEEIFEEDRTLFERVAAGDDTNATRDKWLGAEDDWRKTGQTYGIQVYDDGEAGWTYVGTEEEIAAVIGDEEDLEN